MSSAVISVGGQSATITEWAERTGISKDVIRGRLRLGWDAEAAVTRPVQPMAARNTFLPPGAAARCRALGLEPKLVRDRIKRGWSFSRAITEPAKRPGGETSHPLNGTWYQMIGRCHNPRSDAYQWYGARGITVCPAWRASFWAFTEDIEETIGPRPSPRHSIDRIDNDGDYEPGNIRWATQSEQLRNTRANRIISIGGERRTMTEWAELSGIHRGTLRARLERGWDAEAAVTTPARPRTADNTFFPPGGTARCRELGLDPNTVRKRMQRSGWSFDRAITESVRDSPPSPNEAQQRPPATAVPLALFGLEEVTRG